MPRVRAARKSSGAAPASTTCDAGSSGPPALPPTPPRTTHKRKRRSRSRVTDSSSEDEDDHDVPQPADDDDDDDEDRNHQSTRQADAIFIGPKKRRTLALDAIAEELAEDRAEEAFWLGDSKKAGSSEASSSKPRPAQKVVRNRAPTRKRTRTRSPSSSPPPAPHLLRRGHSGLISPPPSRRAPKVVPRLATPPPESKKKGKDVVAPELDSPNNPFLTHDSPGSAPGSEDLSSPEPRTPKKHLEKPTVAYVFRGVKLVTQNPHYVDPEEDAEREARARLPVNHPDFSPSEACAPKLLFPEARKRDLRKRARPVVPVPTSPTPTTSRRRTGSLSSNEGRYKPTVPAAPGPLIAEEEEDFDAMAAAMASRVSRRIAKGVLAEGEVPRTRESSRPRELSQPPEKDRSDLLKRALGPARRA